MFLAAWLFLAAAVGSLYAGLGAEGLGFFYLAMLTSGISVILVAIQLRRGAAARRSVPRPPQRKG